MVKEHNPMYSEIHHLFLLLGTSQFFTLYLVSQYTLSWQFVKLSLVWLITHALKLTDSPNASQFRDSQVFSVILCMVILLAPSFGTD